MFSEYYFYLTAFIEDEEVRIDRIKSMTVMDERFHIPYSSSRGVWYQHYYVDT